MGSTGTFVPERVVTKGHCPTETLSLPGSRTTTESAITQIWGTGLAIVSQPPFFLFISTRFTALFNPASPACIYLHGIENVSVNVSEVPERGVASQLLHSEPGYPNP